MGDITKIIKKRIGKEEHTFMVTGADFHDVIMKAQKLSFPDVHKCGCCGSDNLALGGHITKVKKHRYATVSCRNCRAQLNFGQQQEDKEVFYLRQKKGPDGKALKDANGYLIYDWTPYDQLKNGEE